MLEHAILQARELCAKKEEEARKQRQRAEEAEARARRMAAESIGGKMAAATVRWAANDMAARKEEVARAVAQEAVVAATCGGHTASAGAEARLAPPRWLGRLGAAGVRAGRAVTWKPHHGRCARSCPAPRRDGARNEAEPKP